MDLGSRKQELLRVLYEKGKTPTNELEEYLGVGTTTLREHIHDLEERGLLEYEKETQGRGRPTHLYYLTDKARELFPSADSTLPQVLFKVLRKSLDPDKIDKILIETLFEYLQSTNRKIKRILERYGELDSSLTEDSPSDSTTSSS